MRCCLAVAARCCRAVRAPRRRRDQASIAVAHDRRRKKICRTPQLPISIATSRNLYAQALGVLSPTDADALRADQGLWLKMRDECRFQVPGNPHVTPTSKAVWPSDVYGKRTCRPSHEQEILQVGWAKARTRRAHAGD